MRKALLTILSIFLLLSSTSFAQDVNELESEIYKILKENHGYKGSGFGNPRFFGVNEKIYLEGLKKFKDALNKTKNIRSFKDIDSLWISDKGDVATHNGSIGRDKKIDLYFPANNPAESFIKLISSNPDKEPEYKKYLKDRRKKVNKAIKEQFGNWFKFHKIGEKILCEHHDEIFDEEKIKKIVEQLSGKVVKKIKYPDSNHDSDNRRVEILFGSPPPSSIKITIYDYKKSKEGSYINVNNKKDRDESDNGLIEAGYDSNCNFIGGQTWEYNSENHLKKKQWLTADGEVKRTVYVNRAVKTFEEIYSHCNHPQQISELLEIAVNRVDRVLVTILDREVTKLPYSL